MPIHFDAAFRPNGWGSKPWAPLLLPLTAIFVVCLAKVVFHFDPKMAKSDPDTRLHVRKVMNQFLLALSTFFAACSVAVIWAAWGQVKAITHVICYGIPILFLILGNLLGKIRPNYVFGIRVPWTLESPTVWTKTHRFGGRVLVVISIAMLLAMILGTPESIYVWVLVAALATWSLTSIGYAFIISRKENHPPHPLPTGQS